MREGTLCWWEFCDLTRGLILRRSPVFGLGVAPVGGRLG